MEDKLKIVAKDEGISVGKLRKAIQRGKVVILKNVIHKVHPIGIGKGLRIKVNTNIGTSPDMCNLDLEIRKLKTAIKYGADTVMDLSIEGNLDIIRRKLLKESTVPFGTVPIYQVAIEAERNTGSILNMNEDFIFNIIQRHMKDGVDFMTIHCGITQELVRKFLGKERLLGMVSRGGSFLLNWIKENQRENPLFAQFEYLLELAKEYEVVLSLSGGLRPGCIFDSDELQVEELLVLRELVKKAREKEVQVMIEGPGHLRINEIESNVKMAKQFCDYAPYFVLGPIVTDIGAGYDHIVSAIGGSIAALAGADFLCVVTPAEHLGFPLIEDIKLGTIASKIAAHSVDIIKKEGELIWDLEINKARSKLDWNLQFKKLIDEEYAKRIHFRIKSKHRKVCSLCGKYCAILLSKKARAF